MTGNFGVVQKQVILQEQGILNLSCLYIFIATESSTKTGVEANKTNKQAEDDKWVIHTQEYASRVGEAGVMEVMLFLLKKGEQ